jgi:E3 ubiquitin-protein ligase SHPRH
VDELAAHAPTLKVLVYEGWAKVKVPITATDAEEERIKRLNARGKDKAKTIKKVAKSKQQPKPKMTVGKRRKNNATTADPETNMDIDEEQHLAGDEGEEVLDWCSYVNTFDVVVTTYQVLRQDFNVARPVPVRPRREDVVYSNVETPRSPLVMCEWNRVVMDEVQMVGGGKTELRILYFL